MEDEPVMSILSGIVVPTEAVVGSQSRFYDDVQPDHHKTPVFAMLDRFTNEMVDDRYFPGPIPIITYDHLPAVKFSYIAGLSHHWNITLGPRLVVSVCSVQPGDLSAGL